MGSQQRHRARPRDCRLVLIEDQPIELLFRIGSADPARMQRSAVMRSGLASARVPTCYGLCGRLGETPSMALGARIRRAQRNRQVGAWDRDAVIAPRIDDHEILCRHMTVDALRTGAPGPMVMMLGHIEFCRQVALTAQGIPVGAQPRAVRVVAIGAGDPRMIHTALQ